MNWVQLQVIIVRIKIYKEVCQYHQENFLENCHHKIKKYLKIYKIGYLLKNLKNKKMNYNNLS